MGWQISRRRVGLLAAATASEIMLLGGCSGVPVTVHLVRHAEKQEAEPEAEPDKDPSLSELGMRRAEGLAKEMGGVSLAAVFSSQFRRTREIVEPSAREHGLDVQVVDAGDVGGLVDQLRQYEGRSVLVSGHSNTVPQIAYALGLWQKLVIAEDEYGGWYVLRSASRWSAEIERRKFEPITPPAAP